MSNSRTSWFLATAALVVGIGVPLAATATNPFKALKSAFLAPKPAASVATTQGTYSEDLKLAALQGSYTSDIRTASVAGMQGSYSDDLRLAALQTSYASDIKAVSVARLQGSYSEDLQVAALQGSYAQSSNPTKLAGGTVPPSSAEGGRLPTRAAGFTVMMAALALAAMCLAPRKS
jgi:hypothetical protein